MDMYFKARKSWRRKFEPRVRVWKLKEEKICKEYRCMVRDKGEEATWKRENTHSVKVALNVLLQSFLSTSIYRTGLQKLSI